MASHLEIELPYSSVRLKVWSGAEQPELVFSNSLISQQSFPYLCQIMDALRDPYILSEIKELQEALSHKWMNVYITYDHEGHYWMGAAGRSVRGAGISEQKSTAFCFIIPHLIETIIHTPEMPDTVRFALISYRNRS